jgi:hypothetical protein
MPEVITTRAERVRHTRAARAATDNYLISAASRSDRVQNIYIAVNDDVSEPTNASPVDFCVTVLDLV